MIQYNIIALHLELTLFSPKVPRSQLFLTPKCFVYVPHCTEFEIFSLGVLMLQVSTLDLPSLGLGGSGTQEKGQCTADLISFASEDDLEPFVFEPFYIYHVNHHMGWNHWLRRWLLFYKNVSVCVCVHACVCVPVLADAE